MSKNKQYKFMKQLEKEIKISFGSFLHPNFLSSQIADPVDGQQVYLVVSQKAHEKGCLYLVVVAIDDKYFCPILHQIKSSTVDFIRTIYSEKVINTLNPFTVDDHKNAIKKSLEYIGFYEKNYTLQSVKKRAIDEKVVEKNVLDFDLMTKQEALRKIAQITPKSHSGAFIQTYRPYAV